MPLWVNPPGAGWQATLPYVHASGSWRQVQNGYVKVSGSWRQFYQNRAPTTVSTFNPIDSVSWRDNGYMDNGWRNDGDTVYQGEWAGYGNHRGFYFYNAASIRSTLQADGGRVINSVKIYLKRENSSHGYSTSESVYAWTHNYESRPPTSTGTPPIYNGPYNVGGFTRGEAKWVSLPTVWGEYLRDGTRDGIAFYDSSGNNYVKLDGQNVASSRGRLEITHS